MTLKTISKIIFVIIAGAFVPAVFGFLVGAGSGSILLGLAAFLFVAWLQQIVYCLNDIHRWTKRINSATHPKTHYEEQRSVFQWRNYELVRRIKAKKDA